jgi:hypothetical protein
MLTPGSNFQNLLLDIVRKVKLGSHSLFKGLGLGSHICHKLLFEKDVISEGLGDLQISTLLVFSSNPWESRHHKTMRCNNPKNAITHHSASKLHHALRQRPVDSRILAMSKRSVSGESSSTTDKWQATAPQDEDPLPSSSLAHQASSSSIPMTPLNLTPNLILPFVADGATWNSVRAP